MQAASNAPTAFALDPRLAGDTLPVADLPLCRALLMNDARWPWVILVPRRAGVAELFDLDPGERQALVEEAAEAAAALKRLTSTEKINVATLGNSVRQFHLHVVARSAGDPNWPGPVWGFGARVPYADEAAEVLVRQIRERLA